VGPPHRLSIGGAHFYRQAWTSRRPYPMPAKRVALPWQYGCPSGARTAHQISISYRHQAVEHGSVLAAFHAVHASLNHVSVLIVRR
jgi:hypothetical protein